MGLFYDRASRSSHKQAPQQAITNLLDKATPDRDYYILLIGAVVLAIGAIFTDSIPALIASMIVAPLAYPILGVGLGIAAGNLRLIGKSLAVLAFSCIIALGIAITVTAFSGNERRPDILISFNGNDHIAFIIAILSGLIAAYGATKPKVASAITGVAIAVSLVPPLVATGISLAPGGILLPGAPILFALNVVGIVCASSLVFWRMGLGKAYRSHSGSNKYK